MISGDFIEDYNGNLFPIKSYKRIISLVPSLTDLLFSFELDNSIVGVTKYCTYPSYARDEPRKVVGGTKNPDIDQIISLKPDIVLMNQEENQRKHYDLLINSKIPVFSTFPRSVLEAKSLFYDLQKLFCINRNEKMVELEQMLTETSKQISTLKRKKLVFCPIWKNPWMSFNKDTFASSIIEFCGGENIFNHSQDRYPKISLDDVARAKPDIILLPDEPYNFQEVDRNELLKFLSPYCPKIEFLSGTFHWYSFIIIDSIKRLAGILLE